MAWEFEILYALQNLRSTLLDTLMVNISALGNSGILWILITIGLLCFSKTRKCGIVLGVGLLLCFLSGNILLKNIIARERPCWIDTSIILPLPVPKDFSFPSGHSMASFAASFIIWQFYKKWGVLCIILASLIAFSRLYLFVHFPTDVAAGIIIGIIFAFVARYLVEEAQKKISSKKNSENGASTDSTAL